MANTTGKKFGGRQKGTQNKLTTSFKELVMQTYCELERKKDKGMLIWALENETDFYKIASKLIPTEMQGQMTGELLIKVIREGNNPKTT
ncbi:hypothetical protein LCGC14_0464020 [marine sediment metagenome]|uniref:Uncharacterized protein n=1 Tax=marine sediment metagenome TaxID=412755 RepID=A0A0F9SJK8_9ZZZZ